MPRRPITSRTRLSALLLALAAASPATRAADNTADGDAVARAQAEALGQVKQIEGLHNPRPGAQWFADAGLGLFIHWGVASVGGVGDLSWSMLANRPWQDGTMTPNEYYGLTRNWKADKVDYDRVLREAKAAGATYAVMVTKHHDGFTFWPSAYGDIGTKTTFGGRDFVKEFVEACRRNGLRVGLYYSPPDWRFERAYKNFSFGRGPALDMDHKPIQGPLPKRDAAFKKAYAELLRGQVTELLTRYGKIDLMWFDGGNGTGITTEEVRKLMPDIVVNRRNGGTGDYGDSEGRLPAKRFKGWFEACIPMWPVRQWSYHDNYGDADAAFTLSLLSMSRAWDGNLLANLGPKGDGSVSAETYACWKEMAAWMAHSGESVKGVSGGPWPQACDVPVTTRAGVAYLHFLPRFPERLPWVPKELTKLAKFREIMPNLGDYRTRAVWKNAPQPKKALLLRTGKEAPFTYDDKTLTVTLPDADRTNLPDVVKLEF